MKNTILILLLSFLHGLGYSNHTFHQDPQKVIAFSGLKLRTSPNMNGKVITVIPFGESVEIQEKQDSSVTIEWLEGTWAKVDFEGQTGYVLDAFLTHLPLPMNDYELSQGDYDISFPLLSWVEHNFKMVSKTDTIENYNHDKIVQHFENGITVSRKEGQHAFEVKVRIPGIRLGDAYNITRSLLLTKKERDMFEEESLFIANDTMVVDKVRIDIESPVEISRVHDGVQIKVLSYQQVCGL